MKFRNLGRKFKRKLIAILCASTMIGNQGGIQNNVAMAWRKKGPKEVGPNWSTIRKYGEKDIIECEICK